MALIYLERQSSSHQRTWGSCQIAWNLTREGFQSAGPDFILKVHDCSASTPLLVTPLLHDRSDSASLVLRTLFGASRRHTKGPWRRVTSRERVGKNLVDFAFLGADILWLLALRIRPIWFMSIRGMFHVRCPFSFKRRMWIPPTRRRWASAVRRSFKGMGNPASFRSALPASGAR